MTAPRALDVIVVGRAGLDLYAQQLGARLEDATSFAKDLGGAAACVALGCVRLGLRVAVVSRVGDDAAGRFATAALAAEGCEVSRVAIDRERPTPLVLHGAERAAPPGQLAHGAELAIDAAAIDDAVLATARAIVVTGSHAAQAATALERARRHGVRSVLDLDDAPLAVAQLAGFDVVVGTRGELLRIAGTADLAAALRAIRAATPATVVVELGAAGCAIVEADAPAREADLRVVPGAAVEILNRCGAGDGFLAGLVHGWLAGMAWRDAGLLGNACAAIVRGRLTGAAAMPTAAELAHFLTSRATLPDADPTLARLHRATPGRRAWDDLCLLSIDDRTQAFELAREAGVPEARLGPLKQLLVRGLAEAEQALALHGRTGVLVDDSYGADALAAAGGRSWWLARPIEVPGSAPLELEGGRSIGTRLIAWPRDHIVKCLVRFHPDEPPLARLEQETQLAAVHRAVTASGHALLLEVVPPAGLASDDDTIVRAVKRLYNIGIHPDWWGVEPQAAPTWRKLDELIAERDPQCRGVLLLDRGDGAGTELTTAAASRSCRGYFLGRATLRAPSAAWLAGAIDDATLVLRVVAACEQRTSAWQRARRTREAT
jgi:5-dehydro-2-deoxygluconokinase